MKFSLKIRFFLVFIFTMILVSVPTNVYAQWTFDPNNSEVLTAVSGNGQNVTVVLPRTAIPASEIAVLVNTADPQSVEVGSYYQQKRNIPAENMIYLNFPSQNSINNIDFEAVKTQVDTAVNLLPNIQAYAITWTKPWKVNKAGSGRRMSITSAFALGYDEKYFNTTSGICSSTQNIEYFYSESLHPFDDFGIRPAMVLGGTNAENVKYLIDNSIASDLTFPSGKGYFLRTTDSKRSVRYETFIDTVDRFNSADTLNLEYIDNSSGPVSGNYLENKNDVLFYFTGLVHVPQISTNTYLPGSIVDHLTSAAGCLDLEENCNQMSALRWLEAGASASYGTVEEPCAGTFKFPDTEVVLPNYFRGQTILESYWKSVFKPGEGVFVGDPLTRPYGTKLDLDSSQNLVLDTTILRPGKIYSILSGDSLAGPFELVQTDIKVDKFQREQIAITADRSVYVLQQEDDPSYNRPILENSHTQFAPQISGNRVVWMDNRNGTEVNTHWDIYYCELDPDAHVCIEDIRLTFDDSDHINPQISGDNITWQQAPATPGDSQIDGVPRFDVTRDTDIFVHNIPNNTTVQITDNFIARQYLSIDGNYIVWKEYNGSGFQVIMIYNILTGKKTVVDGVSIDKTILSKGKIAFEAFDPNGTEELIYLYDIESERKEIVANLQNLVDFDDGRILYKETNTDYIYDTATTMSEHISLPSNIVNVTLSDNFVLSVLVDPDDNSIKNPYYFDLNTQLGQPIGIKMVDQVPASYLRSAPYVVDGRNMLWVNEKRYHDYNIFYAELPPKTYRPEIIIEPKDTIFTLDEPVNIYFGAKDQDDKNLLYTVDYTSALDLEATFSEVVLGDIDGDDIVNATDLSILKSSFFKQKGDPGFVPRADFDNSGRINATDLAILKSQFATRRRRTGGTIVGLFEWTPTPLTVNGVYTLTFEVTDGSTKKVTRDILLSRNDYVPSVPGEIINPVQSSDLSEPQVLFSWSAGSNIKEYIITAKDEVSGEVFFQINTGLNTEAYVENIPIYSNHNVRVTLRSVFDNLTYNSTPYIDLDYVYGTNFVLTPGNMIVPVDGSTITTSDVVFSWEEGVPSGCQYAMSIGTSPGGSNIYSSNWQTATSLNVQGIPLNGEPIYVRLITNFNGEYAITNYQYQTIAQ